MTKNELAKMIDHTLLKADAKPEDIERLCNEAIQYGFASVCVNGSHVALAAELLKASPVRVCSVVGFPLGASAPAVKAFEAARAVADGAGEVDMVMAVGLLQAGQTDAVARDIRAVVENVQGAALVKVILETCLLDDAQKQLACRIARDAGADFVKTSTGFSSGGASEQDIRLMRNAVGDAMGVKASGGIRTYADAEAMIRAGASRIGASASVAIVEACR
ncbi:deoxyribose-phosphate aldolase [Desulfovibrio sp. OttesenSCG-928-G15]|nr:deoxyribose-phosphate aldolase [Desulfovibrio sp. OttesenSCG-928-G15]